MNSLLHKLKQPIFLLNSFEDLYQTLGKCFRHPNTSKRIKKKLAELFQQTPQCLDTKTFIFDIFHRQIIEPNKLQTHIKQGKQTFGCKTFYSREYSSESDLLST